MAQALARQRQQGSTKQAHFETERLQQGLRGDPLVAVVQRLQPLACRTSAEIVRNGQTFPVLPDSMKCDGGLSAAEDRGNHSPRLRRESLVASACRK